MGLDLTIRPSVGMYLGSPDEVREMLAVAFPSAQFGREPSGPEKLEISERQGIRFPQLLREVMMRSPGHDGAVAEEEGFSVEFSWPDGERVKEIHGIAYFSSSNEDKLIEHLARLKRCRTTLHDTGRVIVGCK
jgi:hypothetical protein